MSTDDKSNRLRKTIGLLQATIFGIGLILGAGIYTIIGDVAAIAGNAMWISFIIASIIAVIIGLTYAELASMFPKSAAEYIFSKNAFDNNVIASIIGFLVVFAIIASSATVAVGFSGYLSVFFPTLSKTITAISLVAVLSCLNFFGISESARINIIFTIIELFGLIFIIFAAFYSGSVLQTDYFEFPKTTIGESTSLWMVFSAVGLIFFAYIGFENIVTISDETKRPSKIIPKALISSIVITTVFYILISISVIGLTGWEELSTSNAPLATAAQKAAGQSGNFLLSVIGLFATANTVLLLLIASSRLIYGISSEELLIPKLFAKIHNKRKTPWMAIFVVMVVSSMVIIIFQGSISTIASISVFCILAVYTTMNISLIVMRYRKSETKRPFYAPMNVGKFPVLSAIAIIMTSLLFFQFDLDIVKSSLTSIFLIVIFVIAIYLSKKYRKIK